MRDVERADDLLFVVRALLRVVGDHHDRVLVDHLVEELVGRQDLVERLLQRHAVQLHRVGAVLIVAVVGDVDARRVGDEVEDVADAGVVEPDLRQHLVELDERRRSRLARLLAQLRDVVRRTRLVLLPDAPLDLHHLRGQLAVRRIEIARAPVLAQRLLELAARFGQLRLIQVLVRGVDHRALERNLVVAAVGSLLHGLAVILDRGVPVASARGVLAAAERARSTAPRCRKRQRHHDDQLQPVYTHHCPESRIVWRPRPSTYARSADSTPIFRRR